MTFTQLPKDWRDQPLSDPVLAADVIDLYCTAGDRRRGSIMIVICDEELRFKGAIAVDLSELLPTQSPRNLSAALQPVVQPLSIYPEGAILLALARRGPERLLASDTDWLEASIHLCQALGIHLLGFYLATRNTVRAIPLPASTPQTATSEPIPTEAPAIARLTNAPTTAHAATAPTTAPAVPLAMTAATTSIPATPALTTPAPSAAPPTGAPAAAAPITATPPVAAPVTAAPVAAAPIAAAPPAGRAAGASGSPVIAGVPAEAPGGAPTSSRLGVTGAPGAGDGDATSSSAKPAAA